MKEKKAVLRCLKEEAENIEIPESITPEKMRKKLEVLEAEKIGDIKEYNKGIILNDSAGKMNRNRKKQNKKRFYAYIATAACLCLLAGTAFGQRSNISKFWEGRIKPFFDTKQEPVWTGGIENNNLGKETILAEGEEIKDGSKEVNKESELLAAIDYPVITYEDIYESMFGSWEEIKQYDMVREEAMEGASAATGEMPEALVRDEARGGISDVPVSDLAGAPASDGTSGSLSSTPAINGISEKIAFKEYAASENKSSGILSDSAVSEKMAEEESVVEYGSTNVQTQGVEEADVVKNDGRYLYQKIYQEKDHVVTQAIQIVDTKDGLKEVKRIEGFDNIQEFYIWEDILVIIENKYLEMVEKNYVENEVMICGVIDYGSNSRQYHEITFYNIKDRSMPYKIKTFTLKGRYDSSRISDGYFYGFSKFYASPGEGKTDYASYIPLVDGVQLDSSRILLPEENEGNCYLVLTSVDLKNPTKFMDTIAVVTDSDMYYVSSDNIYIADSLPLEKEAGKKTDQISLLRFSYKDGTFALQAEGKVPGSLESSFSMDEYEGNLRMVTTVNEYFFEELKDDRTGEVIGNHVVNEKQSNALYVLDQSLGIVGKIENLAEEERIYSARFLGETGYFVTFRQTDPLYAVDLKDPENPKILSELKVSGFSEYLHFYGEDRLLGIGMEADEETGSTEGIKLSMFDISNPAEVQEISKLHLRNYHYSEALYNHRAVMISVNANIFGFEMEGHKNGNFKRDYLVFSYENDIFVEKLKVETNNKYGEIYSSRGTFIGDVFYLLTRDGSVKSYDLNTGKRLESLQ